MQKQPTCRLSCIADINSVPMQGPESVSSGFVDPSYTEQVLDLSVDVCGANYPTISISIDALKVDNVRERSSRSAARL